jgi:hypothetical protein
MCNGQNINTSLVGEVGHIKNINFHICTIINAKQLAFSIESYETIINNSIFLYSNVSFEAISFILEILWV